MTPLSLAAPPMRLMRASAAAAVLVVCGGLLAVVLTQGAAQASLAHSLALLAVALCAYGWVLFPTAGAAVASLLLLVCLSWAWAALQLGQLGLDLTAGALLVAVAAYKRRGRARWHQRMAQVLDDLEEERFVKEQALALAGQTRETLQKKYERYAQLQAIAEQLSSMTEPAAIAKLAVDRAYDLIGKSEACLLFLVDAEAQELSLFASRKAESLSAVRAKHGDQFDRYVLRTHRPLLVNDVRRDFRFTVAVAGERTVSSVIACPLMMGEGAEGVLRLDSARPGAYNQDDLRFLDVLLDLVATALMNAKLFAQTQRLASTDGLTGLALRRPFLEQLAREVTRAGRGRDEVSLLMLDVDHFKEYNDTYGHRAGDMVLRAIADVLRQVVPPDGLAARYGGEEFAILLPRAKRLQAGDVAERIRRAVEQQLAVRGAAAPAQHRSGPQRPGRNGRAVTVSIGVASFPHDAKAGLELVRVADQRLYQAKRDGRNLVCAQ